MALLRDLRRFFIPMQKAQDTFKYAYKANSVLPDNIIDLIQGKINPFIIDEYKTSNGFKVNWWFNPEKGIGGEINLSPIKSLLKNEPTLSDECDMDSEMDQELRYFRLFDVPTMNSQVGFFALPNKEISKSLYF